MKINESIITNAQTKLYSIVKSKPLVTKMMISIDEFVKVYVEENNAPFLAEQIYEQKLDEILCNLNPKENHSLLELIKSGSVDASQIAFLKPEELNPEQYEQIIKKREIEEMKKSDKKTTDAFKCSKCHERKCSVEQKQTRSGDEPITTFVTCNECGHSWSFN